ncbi:hypothetical protein [Streptomyces sp. NPDC012825]|uniref:hypothetical protein n=1 Tax=Streptomyces sp. NPDC012825 TaxID=3364851 RepID=UPI00368F27E9
MQPRSIGSAPSTQRIQADIPARFCRAFGSARRLWRSEELRGAWLAELRTVLLKTSSEENLKRTLVFHWVINEAEAFTAGLPGVGDEIVHDA